MDFTPPFGAWLKARRKQLDLTQAALAQRAQRIRTDQAAAHAITACALCDDDGYRGASVCDHTDRTHTTRNGLAAVRAALTPSEDTHA